MLYKGYYLIEIDNNNQVVSSDGSHAELSSVEKALAIHLRLFPLKEGHNYKGIEVKKDISSEDAWNYILNKLYQKNSNVFNVQANNHGLNEEALTMNEKALRLC